MQNYRRYGAAKRRSSTIAETPDGNDIKIVVGMATCGIAAGARNTLKAITDEIEARG